MSTIINTRVNQENRNISNQVVANREETATTTTLISQDETSSSAENGGLMMATSPISFAGKPSDRNNKVDIQRELSEYRKAMMNTMSSTLVETVSIDYEDFNESFLTCATCLCMYDGQEHTPKLLHCSHTVCIECLDRIVATYARDSGQIRCPICRELITIPRGGVSALPPSFLVNQLLDLMARQRREIIPKCSTHKNQELLFCETCDTVFCTLCTGGTHSPDGGQNLNSFNEDSISSATNPPQTSALLSSLITGGNSEAATTSVVIPGSPTANNNGNNSTADHTVIPFSIAIKRMSEILIYKANECRAKLNDANEIVNEEIHKLDHNADEAFEKVNAQFRVVAEAVEKKRQEVLEEVRRKRDEKKKVLEEQLQIIQSEKNRVDSDVQAMRQQVEVRNITKKISDLNCKLDTVSTLSEPRENAYIEFISASDPDSLQRTCCQGAIEEEDLIISLNDSHHSANNESSNKRESAVIKDILDTMDHLGQIKTSKTFPSLCRATMETAIASLTTTARVTTIDYNGRFQDKGGDPVSAQVLDDAGAKIEVVVNDQDDGTYDVKFTPSRPGTYCLKVLIFGRPIKDCPLFFDVTEHNSPVVSFGSAGVNDKEFVQPCNVTADPVKGDVFVIDTGNSRVKRLSSNLDFTGHITNESLEGRSVTGLCMGSSYDTLIAVNWRTKTVTEISLDGVTINAFSHEDLQEPIDVALDVNRDRILVADNGVGKVLIFDPSGKLIESFGSKAMTNKTNVPGKFKDIGAVCVTENGDYIVADSRIQVFNGNDLSFKREIFSQGKGKGRYGGLALDSKNGYLLATRTEKSRSVVQVFKFESGELNSIIDSHGCKMKRPTGITVLGDGHCVVVDIGSDCVRKFRYL